MKYMIDFKGNTLEFCCVRRCEHCKVWCWPTTNHLLSTKNSTLDCLWNCWFISTPYRLGPVPMSNMILSAILLCRLQCSTAMAMMMPEMNILTQGTRKLALNDWWSKLDNNILLALYLVGLLHVLLGHGVGRHDPWKSWSSLCQLIVPPAVIRYQLPRTGKSPIGSRDVMAKGRASVTQKQAIKIMT